ncbi:MAG: calcium/sodium antiporter [Clostridia bacterium]|nr:calcium/sodium antiporter [Clostridia bacterium]NCC42328.1 calcium/sodium antiporter [Clostridia bacterium]
MILDLVILVIGFALLIKGADFLVAGAAGIAERFHIPQIVIGLTIVAFGTSAPEAAISISAGLKGATGISIGNVVGSNILNILLILGITACIVPLKVEKSTIKFEIPFTIFITILLVIMGNTLGEIGFFTGCLFWLLFIVFLAYLYRISRQNQQEELENQQHKMQKIWVLALVTVGGLAAIIFGSDLTVDSATSIATRLGMSDRLIGLTIVAFGTSLPELVTSVTAARKNNVDIAIGNIVGSNIFNILFVLGTTCLVATVPYASKFFVDGLVCIGAAVLLWLCVAKTKVLKRWGGVIFLISYGAYFVYLLTMQ